MTTTTALPAWIAANLAAGFALGTHFLDDGTAHVTSLELGVAVVEATGERVHYCHECEGFADERVGLLKPAPETFSALVVRIAREHERLVDELHAAASLAGVTEKEADALLVEEIEAGPVA